ncbi:MAG: protein kinase domain-containing protein [Planctomycetota bacterium]|jgi:hypothetical protein
MSSDATQGGPTAQPPNQEWLVGCSRERTLVARRGETGDVCLVKIFEQGSLQEARQEAELARGLARPGLVQYRQATQDPVTGKPCVVMEFCNGEDLARYVSTRGPLAATAAAQITLEVARVLLGMHQQPLPQAPHGVIHRDMKPGNVLLTMPLSANDEGPRVTIIDLEHAVARLAPARSAEPPSSVGFRGGTHGYAPPEAYLGLHPDPAFDVFGLGATLHFMLTGANAFRGHDAATLSQAVRANVRRVKRLSGLSPALRSLVDECLAADATARPTMAAVVTRLEQLLAARRPTDKELDRVWKLARAAEFTAAEHLLDRVDAAETAETVGDQRRALRQLIARLARLHASSGGMPRCESALSTEPADVQSTAEQIARTLPRLIAFLERFPTHEDARTSCLALQAATHRLLEVVPPRVNELKQHAAFDDASHLLEMTMTAVRAALRMPGPIPTTVAKTQGHLPSPLYRDPLRFLQRNLESVANVRRAHQKLLARLAQSEARLDLRQAGQVLTEVGAIYTGASSVTAELKDRLHHLDYYLANIARSRPQLRELAEELDLVDLPQRIEVVEDFQQLCAQRTVVGQQESGVRGKTSCHGLHRTLQDMCREFPHTEKAARPAMDALASAMQALTSMAWDLIEASREKLDATPLPIRPVQSLVNKLDRLRLLRSFVDQQDRSRADLARAARDQLARGAQESEQKGHLTTALYDMARAVDSFSADVDSDDEGPSIEQLRQQYEELKHKKERLEQAAVDNHRLAAWYAELQDRSDSSFTDRVQALEQRTEVLELLLANVDEERGASYAADLREVQVHLVQEHANDGERRLAEATTEGARLEAAETTLTRLRHEALAAGPGAGGGRVGRILDHWGSHVERARQALREKRDADRGAASVTRRARFVRAVVVLLVVVSGLAIYYEVFGGEKPMADLLASLHKTELKKHQLRRVGGEVYYPRLPACVELVGFVRRLEDADPDPLGGGVVAAARKLVDELNQLAEAPAGASCLDWVPRVRAHLRVYKRALEARHEHIYSFQEGPAVLGKLHEFGRVAHVTGVNMAATLPDARAHTLENVLRRQDDLGLVAIGADDIDRVLQVLR